MKIDYDYLSMGLEILIMFCFLLIAGCIFFGYQYPTLIKQEKQMTCLDNGYFDYEESTDSCYDLGRYHVDKLQCVRDGNCKGRHYEGIK